MMVSKVIVYLFKLIHKISECILFYARIATLSPNKAMLTCDKKSTNDAQDCYPPLKAGQGVPLKFYPGMGRKLGNNSLDLASVGWDFVQAAPVVFLFNYHISP